MTGLEDDLRTALHRPADPAMLARLSAHVQALEEMAERPAQHRLARSARLAPLVAAAVVLLVVVFVAAREHDHPSSADGAASRQPYAGHGGAPPIQPTYLGPVSTQQTAADGNLLLDPPDGHTPRLTALQAYQDWCNPNDLQCGRSPAEIVLALLSGPGTNHVLSYVITWTDVECPHISPAMPTKEGTAAPPVQPRFGCTEVGAVDATTGQAIAGDYYN